MMFITALKRCYDFSQKYGLKKALKLFYFLYYGKFKQRKIKLSKDRIIKTKTGCELYVIPNDPGISLELSIFQIHEPITTEVISKKLKKDMVCVDIGANLGYFATLEGQIVGSGGKVIAIEPLPDAFRYLQKNLKLQNQTNYETYNCACYDEDTNASFLIHEKSNVSKIIKDYDAIPPGMKKIVIPVRKLDTILSSNPQKIDFLRMDIEGHELLVLKGARNIIKKYKPMIQFELHSKILGYEHTKELLDFIKDEDYKISYFLIRELDMPIIGTINDLKKDYTINDLLHLLETDTLPPFIQLFLEFKN